jgi:hypothetical protein
VKGATLNTKVLAGFLGFSHLSTAHTPFLREKKSHANYFDTDHQVPGRQLTRLSVENRESLAPKLDGTGNAGPTMSRYRTLFTLNSDLL